MGGCLSLSGPQLEASLRFPLARPGWLALEVGFLTWNGVVRAAAPLGVPPSRLRLEVMGGPG